MMRATHIGWTACALFMLAVAASGNASASTLKTLYTFCEQKGCGNGSSPEGNLVMDQHENIFGILGGGGIGYGAIYELRRTGKGAWKFKVLYRFCSEQNCTDGRYPQAGLIVDVSGNLYGTTSEGGGDNHYGTVFELKNEQGVWGHVVLHAFTDSGHEGGSPSGALTYTGAQNGMPYDGVSHLFGTTQISGDGVGTVFQLTPSGDSWTLQTIHDFTNLLSDGGIPYAGLIPDSAGNLYGTTLYGGGNGGGPNYAGTVFELSPSGGDWTESILYRFCAQEIYCADFEHPWDRLAMDASGALLGTAADGGPICYRHNHCGGGVFKLSSNEGQWTYNVVYGFCGRKVDDIRCPTGKDPQTGLTLDSVGNAYGTTKLGGLYGVGVVFKLEPDGAYTTLYDFCSLADCSDGKWPLGELLTNPRNGHLYGTTLGGGANDGGTIFELIP